MRFQTNALCGEGCMMVADNGISIRKVKKEVIQEEEGQRTSETKRWHDRKGSKEGKWKDKVSEKPNSPFLLFFHPTNLFLMSLER